LAKKSSSTSVHLFPPDTRVFRSKDFFNGDFPFAISRVKHTSKQFEDGARREREFWKITLVLAGKGKALINESQYQLQPGSVFIVHPRDQTTYQIESETLECYNVLFLPRLFSGELESLTDHYSFFYFFSEKLSPAKVELEARQNLFHFEKTPGDFLKDFETLEREFKTQDALYRPMIRHRLLELLIRLSRNAANKSKKAIHLRIADYIDRLIEKHYESPLHLEVFTLQAGISRDRLARRYRAERGKTITEALNEFRVAKAAELLKDKKLSATDVCHSVGFSDLSFFYKLFRKKYGVSPRKFVS
jgi:AraC-like DNA-binding protein